MQSEKALFVSPLNRDPSSLERQLCNCKQCDVSVFDLQMYMYPDVYIVFKETKIAVIVDDLGQ